jgi:hypothetical protein
MSTNYFLYDPVDKSVSPLLHAQQAWGSWTSDREDITDWLSKHRRNKPYVIDEHSAEKEEDNDKNITNSGGV